jgi:murein DD-endopeptidase MepM/ murein hydrolase activator NlpD
MNVILIRKSKGGSGYINLCRRRLSLIALAAFFLLPLSMLSVGFWWGSHSVESSPDVLHVALRDQIEQQHQELEEASRNATESMNALAVRMGQLQAHVIRLDALGQRLTKMADLDSGEFDFENPPAQGGPHGVDVSPLQVPDFLDTLNTLSKQLDDRDQQLSVLESMLMSRNLQAEVFPAGRPIKRGWTSSYFGKRTDPFTGRREWHAGMDFAGKEGSDVVAVASGVVTWAGSRYGYGNLVEINHGNGYVTRYGHNKEVLVKVGETVKKGQRIALMGSTGRSTGPHVHFEVIKDGRHVNPAKYIRASR